MHNDYYSESDAGSIIRASRHVLIKILFLFRQQHLTFFNHPVNFTIIFQFHVSHKRDRQFVTHTNCSQTMHRHCQGHLKCRYCGRLPKFRRYCVVIRVTVFSGCLSRVFLCYGKNEQTLIVFFANIKNYFLLTRLLE